MYARIRVSVLITSIVLIKSNRYAYQAEKGWKSCHVLREPEYPNQSQTNEINKVLDIRKWMWWLRGGNGQILSHHLHYRTWNEMMSKYHSDKERRR